MNKINLMILLSTVSLIQASGKGMREVPTPQGHIGRTYVVDADSELGAIMQSMNDREAQAQLESFRKEAQKTSLPQVIRQCDKLVQDLNEAIENRKDINGNWFRRILAFTQRNCKTLKTELETQK